MVRLKGTQRDQEIDLKAERINRGLTLKALSEAVGVPKSTLARVENGGPRPSTGNALAIADFYGYKVTDIWPVSDSPAPQEASAA